MNDAARAFIKQINRHGTVIFGNVWPSVFYPCFIVVQRPAPGRSLRHRKQALAKHPSSYYPILGKLAMTSSPLKSWLESGNKGPVRASAPSI